MGVVEHEPARQVGVVEARRVELVQRAAEGVVVGGLVGEPSSVAVDDDRAGGSARAARSGRGAGRTTRRLGCAASAPTTPRGSARARAPARIAIRKPSPVLPGYDAAPSIGPRRKASTRSRSHSNPPVAITTPPAAAISTSPSGVERATPVDRPVVDEQVEGAVLEPRLDAAVEQGGEQPTDQRRASTRAGRRGGGRRAPRGRCAPSPPPEVGLVQRQVRVLRRSHHAAGPLAEAPEREQSGIERAAPTGAAARLLGVVVGEALDDREAQVGHRLDPVDGVGPVVDERLGQVGTDQPV